MQRCYEFQSLKGIQVNFNTDGVQVGDFLQMFQSLKGIQVNFNLNYLDAKAYKRLRFNP